MYVPFVLYCRNSDAFLLSLALPKNSLQKNKNKEEEEMNDSAKLFRPLLSSVNICLRARLTQKPAREREDVFKNQQEREKAVVLVRERERERGVYVGRASGSGLRRGIVRWISFRTAPWSCTTQRRSVAVVAAAQGAALTTKTISRDADANDREHCVDDASNTSDTCRHDWEWE